jgi:WD40 repeat protein
MPDGPPKRLALEANFIYEVAWSPDGTMLASGGQDGAIYLWNPLTGASIEEIAKENEQDSLGFLDWSPDGYFLAYAGNQNYINGWNVDSREKTVFAQSQTGITGISWSPDDTKLANSSTDGKVTVWDRQTGKSIWIIDAHTGWTNDVNWALDGSLLASGGDDGEFKIWDPKTGKLVEQSTGTTRVFGVAFSPAVISQIAWGSGVGEVTITESDMPDRRLKAGSGQVWVVAWSPDGKQLAAGTEGNTVFVWDATTGQQVQLLTVPTH